MAHQNCQLGNDFYLRQERCSFHETILIYLQSHV